jgi:Calcineurin-like phosphoesterase
MTKISRRQFLAGLSALGTLVPEKLAAARAPAQSISVVRPPFLQSMRPDGVTVMWATLQPGAGYVRYLSNGSRPGLTRARRRTYFPSETGMPFAYEQYQADLVGLKSNRPYVYNAMVNGQQIGDALSCHFRTAGPGPLDFLVLGDSGQSTPEQFAIASRMALEHPSFILHVGDIAYMDGTFAQFHSNYFQFYSGLMSCVPFFTSPGNHEYVTNDAAAYLALHSVPQRTVPINDWGRYYSFDWGNAHFVSLDSNASLEQAVEGNGRMLAWLENDLKFTRAFWRIVFFHHPPYATGLNQGDIHCSWAREKIVPILESYGVHVVFNGHEHSYHRSHPVRDNTTTTHGDGTLYITSGGGGARLYPVFAHPLLAVSHSRHHYIRAEMRGVQLTLRAIGIEGTEIDSVVLRPAPAIESTNLSPMLWRGWLLMRGTRIQIVGRGLAGEEGFASKTVFQLAGTVVTINDRPISLLYVSPNRIDAFVSFRISGSATLRVTTSNGSSETVVSLPDEWSLKDSRSLSRQP